MALVGNSKFTWSGGGEHELNLPPQAIRRAGRQRRYVGESLDYTVREVTTIGSVTEIYVTIRYEDDPNGLINLILAGHAGEIITLVEGAVSTQYLLIEPSSEEFELSAEVDFRAFGEQTIELRLRQVGS